MATAGEVEPKIHDPHTVGNNQAILNEKKDSTSDLEHQHAENPTANANNAADREHFEKYGTYEKYEITEEDCYEELGFSFPNWKKWLILSIVFLVQVSMNFNTSLYSNAVGGISKEFGVSAQAARLGAALFLITYAFGCELWAPWSEELGRWPILQLSLFFVNIWQIPVGIAPNFGTILAFRSLGGLSTAGGSVTLAMVADMWEANEQQYAVAFIVFSSVGGSVLGPIVGGFVEQFLAWRWNIWIQLIFGGAVQIAHALIVPETRTTVLMDRIAKKRRAEGEKNGKPVNIWGPNELRTFKERFNPREILTTWMRPFRMFLTEPIVLVLSLLSGFSDAIIFMFLQSYALVFEQWDFAVFSIGLAFCGIGVGYFIAWASFIPAIKRNERLRRERPGDEQAQYESRLWWLLYTAPCLPIGLIIFAWTSTGPPIHWMGPIIGSAIIGIANYAIYMATIDYMICAYGPYSASATGGNGWARDFLAGVLTLPATPFFKNIGGKNHLANASTILFCISVLLVISVYVIYWKGPVMRARSPFAQQLSSARNETGGRRVSALPGIYGSRQNSVTGSMPTSRRASATRAQAGEHRHHTADGMRKINQKENSQVPAGIEQH
ncbi:hypothetical protein HBI56_026030 [Parastagonospora nodorum]|uniref:Major facilitator superfamily (MFS) profile domain-containing protein n=2 Tax=Phaeosphaeria nodorum (strain SN15 / ATCC MYA-4574 / FGSC 10173) TaxID=321614 RepID=A0A7U2EXE5_PHANO|nr:hypothetical protein SNOG_02629 [Parastagonospora nodorum SN15]KAH3919385.1 hypothetical protein HBH56_013690 [Parastagonospora nodorum]EAT89360.1 hypothetical protein SNOG_02629 [Parastagonospora nodorum SN15]KAH3936760.1 hypothetical protein HBH54_020770 [Parastagonospora nodorum]KAH3953565.1 hypothetical protein HBH53_033170 [Parastagonospora nodorum]KAH3969465.1 hypothetical protein HBH51_125330 [Parastagonospora nodorum]